MIMYSLGLINGQIYSNGKFIKSNIYVEGEKIKKITNELLQCEEVVDCEGKLLLPGFIDPHVHLNLHLGEFTSADDYESGSIAAAFGGVTTFIDFLEPISYTHEFKDRLNQKMLEAEKSHIDYSFHPTLGNFKDHTNKLVDEIIQAGLPSVKVFTTYSDSDRRINYQKLKELLEASKSSGILVLVHAENDAIILSANVPDKVENYADSRPPEAELTEIPKLASMVKETEGHMYIVHVTCGSSLELLLKEYPDLLGKNLFIESCPQYFTLSRDVYNSGNGILYILAPPLRSQEEVAKLHENIDVINTIGTDHCPFTKSEKLKYSQPSKVPKGLGSVEFSFPLMYSLFGSRIIDKFTINPAKIHGLYPVKGILREGADADIVIFDPSKSKIIDKGHSRADYSPYEGKKVKGSVVSTLVRGSFIIREGKFVGEKIKGKFLKRRPLNDSRF